MPEEAKARPVSRESAGKAPVPFWEGSPEPDPVRGWRRYVHRVRVSRPLPRALPAGSYPLASPLHRLAASMVDVVLLLIVGLVGVLVTLGGGETAAAALVWTSRLLALALVVVGWAVWGQTPGKRLLGLKIVAVHSPRLTFAQVLLRAGGYMAACLPLHLGLLAAAWHPRRQGWHDRLAGTLVVDVSGRRPLSSGWLRGLVSPLADVGPAAGETAAPLPIHPLPWRHVLLAAAAYVLAALLFTRPLVFHLATHRIGGPGHDGSLFMWALWYMGVGRQLDAGPSLLFTHLFYWPSGVSLLYHTMNWANAFLAQPLVQRLPLPEVYNLVLLGCLVLSCLGAFCLARACVGDSLGAWVGGLVFGLGPFVMGQARGGHLNQVSLYAVPWAAFAALGLYRPRWWRFVLLGAVAVALSGYLDFYDLVFAALAFMLVAVTAGRLAAVSLPRLLFRLALVGGGAVLLLLPLLLPALHQFGPQVKQQRSWQATINFGGVILPNPYNPLVHRWGPAPSSLTREGGYGLGLTVSLLVLLEIRRRRRSSAPWIALLVAGLLLAGGSIVTFMGITGVSAIAMLLLGGLPGNGLGVPWDTELTQQCALWLVSSPELLPQAMTVPSLVYRLLQDFPPISCMVAPARFVVLALLAGGVLAAGGLQSLRTLRHPRLAAVLPGLFAALVVLELLPTPAPISAGQDSPFYSTLRHMPGRFAVIDVPVNEFSRDYFEYQTRHGRPMLTAVHSRPPPDAARYIEAEPLLCGLTPVGVTERGPVQLSLLGGVRLDRAAVRSGLRHLERDGFRYLLVHKEMVKPESLVELSRQLGSVPGVRKVYEDRALAAWEIGGGTEGLGASRSEGPAGARRAAVSALGAAQRRRPAVR